jgi:sterol desaturase/sphingolipid hydroxylase (fatty acid hydroxylase superfamily)
MPDLPQFDLTILAIPSFIILMLVESIVVARQRARATAAEAAQIRGYEVRDTAASLAMGVGNVLINLVMKAVSLSAAIELAQFAPWKLDPSSVWTWIALLVATDFCYYWFHRFHHEIRFFWGAHENHHSSRHYNLSTALRQSWMTPFTGILFYVPLPLLGFEPKTIVAAIAINTLYQFWIHTEAIDKLGPLEWIINTPSHHRVHHGRNVQYLDKNYAGMFIIWDKLFGSFEPEVAPVDYGLTKNIDTFNPVKIAFHEWAAMFRCAAQASSLSEAWNYLVQPPGWSPDGRTQTAAQMQAELGKMRDQVPGQASGTLP